MLSMKLWEQTKSVSRSSREGGGEAAAPDELMGEKPKSQKRSRHSKTDARGRWS